MRTHIVFGLCALAFCVAANESIAQPAPTEFQLTKDGVGPLVIVAEVTVNGKEAQLKASARNDSGQPIRYAKFCVLAAGRAKGCDFELWTTATWKPGEELTWAPLKETARPGIEKLTVTLTNFDAALPLPAAPPPPPPPAASKPAPPPPTPPTANAPKVTRSLQAETPPPPPAPRPIPAGANVLPDGTPVRIRINRTISSADAKVGDTVDFEVLDEIKVGDLVAIPKGSIAMGTVTEAESKRHLGRGGKLNVVIDYARLSTGEKVPLRAVKENQGGGHVGAMTGAIVATSIIFFPAAPLFLFMEGKDITVPKGTEVAAYVNGDYPLPGTTVIPSTNITAAQPMQPNTSVVTGVLTNDDVVALKQAGLSDEVILAKIKTSKAFFKVDTDGIVALKKTGISDAVILAMINAAGR